MKSSFKKRMFIVLAVLAMVLTFAPAVAASDDGNCSTKGHWIASEQSYNWARKVKANVDVNASASLCDNAGGIIDNGTFHGVTVAGNTGYDGRALIWAGVAECDVPQIQIAFCRGDGNERQAVHVVACGWPNADQQFDHGAADVGSTGNDFEIAWDEVNNEWDVYGDGGAYLRSFPVSNGDYSCMNPEGPSSTQVYALWGSERWDLGDGWGEVTKTHFSNLFYAAVGGSGWISSGDGTGCDANNHNYTPHRQYCSQPIPASSSSMDTWTIY